MAERETNETQDLETSQAVPLSAPSLSSETLQQGERDSWRVAAFIAQPRIWRGSREQKCGQRKTGREEKKEKTKQNKTQSLGNNNPHPNPEN